ncbi:MAG: hypothetical protein HYV28_21455 [Ignavibacteriales bacterium]|nr:hypothetical protein [Ignavibacteriales bacterium]
MKLFLSFSAFTVAVFFAMYLGTGSLSDAVIGGLAVSLLYIFILPLFASPETLSRLQKTMLVLASWILIAGSLAANLRIDKTTKWQKKSLLATRAIIGSSILNTKLTPKAVKLFDVFNLQAGNNKATMSVIASRMFSPLEKNNNKIEKLLDTIHGKEVETGALYMSLASADSVVFTATDTIALGLNPSFKNFGGNTGKIQSKISVSPNGITYTVEN